MKDQFIGTNTKQKVTNKFRYFLESIFVGANGLFVLVYLNRDKDVMRFKTLRYYLPKGIIQNYIMNGKIFYDQPIDSDIKRFEEIRKLTARQGEDYTAGCVFID